MGHIAGEAGGKHVSGDGDGDTREVVGAREAHMDGKKGTLVGSSWATIAAKGA